MAKFALATWEFITSSLEGMREKKEGALSNGGVVDHESFPEPQCPADLAHRLLVLEVHASSCTSAIRDV